MTGGRVVVPPPAESSPPDPASAPADWARPASERFGKGDVLLQLTPTHGVDSGDLPALALLLVAACLAI